MQIKELTLPPNQKKITYEISKNGKTNVYTTSPHTGKKTYLHSKDIHQIHLGQLNSIQISQDNQLQNILAKNPFNQSPVPSPQKPDQQKQINCSCKKSKCLKMYCECFAKNIFCSSECTCLNCTNTQINAKRLMTWRQEIVVKKSVQRKGCKCMKSGCNKKYCECYSADQKCGIHCLCLNCQNAQKTEGKSKKHKS